MNSIQIKDSIHNAIMFITQFKGYIVTDVKEAKTVRAEINRYIKEVNDKKIKYKKELLKTFEPIEKAVKEFVTLANDIQKNIAEQIKGIEEEEKKRKQVTIDEMKEAVIMITGLTGVFANIPDNPKWYNKSYSIKAIEKELQEIAEQKRRNQVLYEKTKNNMETYLEKINIKYGLEVPVTLEDINFPEPTEEMIDTFGLQEKAENIAEKRKATQEAIINKIKPKEEHKEDIPEDEPKQRYEIQIMATEKQYRKVLEYIRTQDIEILF